MIIEFDNYYKNRVKNYYGAFYFEIPYFCGGRNYHSLDISYKVTYDIMNEVKEYTYNIIHRNILLAKYFKENL